MSRFPLSERWYRWSGEHVAGIDRVIASVLSVLCAVAALASDAGIVGTVVSLGMTVPLAWRRTRVAASGFTIAAFAAVHVVVIPDQLLASAIAVPIALYALAAYGPRRASGWGLGIAILGAVAAGARYFRGEGISWQEQVFATAFLVLFVVSVWAFGDLRRVRNQELAGLTERARLLELERAQEAELAAVNERTRIAREMHDIVAHSLTVVIAQADGGRYSAKADPEAAIAALTTISDTGRQALTDMRALLSVLREDRPRDYASTPGVSDMDALIEEIRAGGLAVEHTSVGERRALSTGAELTAYRIAQESLTNVLKHAGRAARVQVREHWTDSALELTIEDDGGGAYGALVEPSAGGQGVIGMRERVELYGGRFSAAPAVGGGFRVHAELPYERGE
ncbi:sensor histidine kinase [Rhodococcus spelaei]|uniref:histidine kinase n=1 Tax=Rhodococcus spelaei TaxID=2546320 RepID=A0A541B147_9NOCA|nr:sensor histidine kinase [Rhodococcus spelaei]TQF66040.1 sensor histidine kinase [Rhodococcus spelaei]